MKPKVIIEAYQENQTTATNEVSVISIKKESLEENRLLATISSSDKVKAIGRLMIFLICVIFLVVGRYIVPQKEVICVQDKIINALHGVNSFLNTAGNHHFRDFAQIFCSLLMDITFILTFGNWVRNGTTGRLPLSMGAFYVTRALVQQIWFSPFPEGYYWDSPGVPSLVVPYGRGSDFFFSGHAGFMMICALEWHKLNVPKIRNFVILSGIYTVFILLSYRIHYSIDVFVGIFFAEWCFNKIDKNQVYIDALWTLLVATFKNVFLREKVIEVKQDENKADNHEENPIEKVCSGSLQKEYKSHLSFQSLTTDVSSRSLPIPG